MEQWTNLSAQDAHSASRWIRWDSHMRLELQATDDPGLDDVEGGEQMNSWLFISLDIAAVIVV